MYDRLISKKGVIGFVSDSAEMEIAMLRFLSILFFLILYFLFGMIAWVFLFVIGKFNMELRHKLSLKMVQNAFRFILRFCSGTSITVLGRERIPANEAVLYVGNHRSYFDILIIYSLVPGLTGFVAKKEMEKIPFLSTWMSLVNCLFLDRKDIKQGLKTILEGIEKVKNGISICIFPEGTRNRGEDETELMEFKEGSLKIAEKSGCPIIPVAMNNNAAIFEAHTPKIKRAHVVIEFGEPIYPKELDKEQKKFIGAYTKERIVEMIKKNQTLV